MLNDVGDVILPKQVVTPDGRVFKVQAEIDDLGKALSKKNLSDIETDLLSAGWVKEVDGNITKFILKVPIGNGYDKKFILHHNSMGVDHSINGQPIKYWKLYEDKKSSKKVLFRSSSDSNFEGGGHGKTFMSGTEQ